MEWSTLILSVLVGAVGIYYIFLAKLDSLKKLGILHVKPLPFFGNMAPPFFRQRGLSAVIHDAYKLSEEAQYTGLYNFSNPVIVIRSPELIKNIAVKNFDHFVDRRNIIDINRDPIFGNMLFLLGGDKWRDTRHLLTPSFTGSKMKHMFKLMSNCGKDFSHYLHERSMKKPHVLNMKDAFTRYTNDVITTCAFGITIDSMKNPENEFYTVGKGGANLEGSLSAKLIVLTNFPTIAKWFDVKVLQPRIDHFFTDLVKETIEARAKMNITRPDMMQLMMNAGEKTKISGDQSDLSITDMGAQAFNFFAGNFEAASGLMCFVAHVLAVNKDIQKRLQDEVDEVLEKTNGDVTYEAVNEMQFLDAVISETLRIYPIVIFHDRVCVKTFELPPALPGGKAITIEPGQSIWFPVCSIHRDPKYFQDPDKFDPERFMGNRKNDIDPYTFFPFGMGPRKCIAHRFVLLQTKVVLFHLLAMCHLNACPKTSVPFEVSKNSIVLTAKDGFWLQLESRTGS